MRSDSRSQKVWHTAIGITGICALIVASVLNSTTQREYAEAFNRLSNNVQKLARPAQAEKGSSVDQILAAAASKLIQQDTEINQLRTEIRGVTHPSNGFYEGDQMVAAAQGNAVRSGNGIVFQLVVSGENGIDFKRVYKFQNLDLKCENPGRYGQVGSFGVIRTEYPGLRCTVLPNNDQAAQGSHQN